MGFKKFNLDPRILAAVVRAGYSVPTPVQEEAIPAVLAGHDCIGTAQTGTGKTAAFVLPILQRLLEARRGRTAALVLTPTRELAEQIHQTFTLFAAATKIRSATVYGGVGQGPQVKAMHEGVEVLVACPGRLLDLMDQGHARFDGIQTLVLDEADRMFDMGFLPSVRRILGRLPRQRQTLLFSATFPEEVEKLAAENLRHPKRVAIGLTKPAHTVAHALFPVPQHLKTQLLIGLLRKTGSGSVLVFTRTRHRAEKVARQVKQSGFKAASLHSDRTQGQRQAALNGFRDRSIRILVATDIAARGLDVETVTHVINFDMPDTADAYIHRIGRTGRAERTGDAFTLTVPDDADMIRTLEKIIGKPLERRKLEGFDYGAEAPVRTAYPARPAQTPASGRGGAFRSDRGRTDRTRAGQDRADRGRSGGSRSGRSRSDNASVVLDRIAPKKAASTPRTESTSSFGRRNRPKR
ncbi:DEAD/DEAH box helicase [bacterium]|nr:DEAD/DEAH box helicase [bacterium]